MARPPARSTTNTLFYLRSRGLDEAAARALLTFAFCRDVIGRVPLAAVRDAAETLVAGALPDRELIRGTDLMAAVREAAPALRRRPRARRLSRARAPDQRPSARLPRQRRLVAAAVAGDRRGRGLRARPSRERPPRRAHALAGGDRAVRGRAREGAALRQCGVDRGDRLRPRHDRGDQPGRPVVRRARGSAQATRSSSPRLEHHSNIVPWQILAAQTGASLRVVPIDRRGVRRLRGLPEAARPAHANRRARARLERARHGAAARGFRRRRARARDRDRRRRRAGGPAPGRRRAGARLRLLRLLRAQDVRPDRHRRAVRARSRCSPRCRRGRAAAT